MGFSRVLLTGAAGRIGSCLRPALREHVDELRLSDRVEPASPASGPEAFFQAELADAEAVARAVDGVEAVIHLGGVPDETSFDKLAPANLIGGFNVFEAARRSGVTRVIYASSNRIIGFHPVTRRLTPEDPVRPDGLYGVTKAFGEALGRMYADRFGLEVVCVRIGSFDERPSEARHLTTWLSPADAVRLFRACLDAEAIDFLTVWGVSANTRSWWEGADAAARIGYEPRDDAERFADELPAAGEDEGTGLQGGRFTAPGYGGWA